MTKKTSPWMAADPGPMPRVSAATLPRLSRKFAVLNCALFHGIRHYLQFAKVVHMDETTMAFLVPREEASAALAAINGHLAVAGLSSTREDVLRLARMLWEKDCNNKELIAKVYRMIYDKQSYPYREMRYGWNLMQSMRTTRSSRRCGLASTSTRVMWPKSQRCRRKR